MDSRSDRDLNILDTNHSPGSIKSNESQNTEMETKYPDYCQTLIVKDSNGQMKELVFPKALDLDRPKRARTTFSQDQLYRLEEEFQRNQYLVGRERTDLSRRLELSETQIKVWFQNRRTKFKRDKQKDQDVRGTTTSGDNFSSTNLIKLLTDQPSPPTTTSSNSSRSTFGPVTSTIPHISPYPPPHTASLGTTAMTHLPYLYPNAPPPTAANFPFNLAGMNSQHPGLYAVHRNFLPQS